MEMEEDQNTKIKQKRSLLILSCILLTLGNCGGPLVMRLYFIHGGKRVWLSSWLETGGWPIILLPLAAAYYQRRRRCTRTAKPIQMKPFLFFSSALIGLLTGLDDYLYAEGVARLPVSTLSLIIASHLGFTAAFAYLLVKQKFTSYSVNAVVLLTMGGAVLALHTSGDRPKGESEKEYIVGFFMTLSAAALYGFVLPLVELMYKKSKQRITYSLVLEVQLVMCFFATVFCTIGMLINNDFKVIPREAKKFGMGETEYYVVLVWSAIVWQAFFLGAIGIIFCASSLVSAIVIASLLPVTEVLAVIFYHENFKAEKGVSLALSLWGFVSYFYGEIKHTNKNKKMPAPQESEIHGILDTS
ncbi:hypothetical protein G4B88_019357 [Cannabis sativa]|uniref:Probable purine permease n=2 Tax=Cannabis sativa TaxID=3483 RepID=A0A7J6HZL1_CANSA|nr:hypothetical protein G4B88_019357 [Cannabis sativa]